MKKSHFTFLLSAIILIFLLVAMQIPGVVFASDPNQDQDPKAVTLTPSNTSKAPTATQKVPTATEEPTSTDTTIPDTLAPTDTLQPTATSTFDPGTTATPTNTQAATMSVTPTNTRQPGTPIPTERPRPGGAGNLQIITLWAFLGGLSGALLLWLARSALTKTSGSETSSGRSQAGVKAFVPVVFVRRWVIVVLLLMLLGMILGFVIVNFP